MNRLAIFLLGLCPSLECAEAQTGAPARLLSCAHSHNDYLRERPLHAALQLGCASIEVDLFLVDGELRVGHTRFELRPGRTIETLYLEPLWERFHREKGAIYPCGLPLQLLVDFKSAAGPTWRALSRALARFRPMLTRVEDGIVHHGAVSVVISGNRPIAELQSATERLARLDGRPDELGEGYRPQLCPLVSERWSKLFSWRGKGAMPAAERTRLESLVAAGRRGGQTLRFWATPEQPAIWRTLLESGVDWLHVDDLDALHAWMNAEGFALLARRGARRLARPGAGAGAGITAHRGFSHAYPENTLVAFERAIELGVDWIECDVFRTRDGELVVIHDARTGRVAERDLAVAESDCETLAGLDVAHAFRRARGATLEEVPPARIPTLRELLLLVRKRAGARLSIQPKQDIVEEVVALVRELEMEPWVAFNEGSLARVRRVKALAPEIPIFYDTDGQHTADHLRAALRYGFEGIVMHHRAVDADDVERIHSFGLEAGAWTVNDEAEMRRLLKLGIDRIYTDRPDLLKRCRAPGEK